MNRDLRAAATHGLSTLRHPSALPGCATALCPGSCPAFPGCDGGGSRFASDPGPACWMLLLMRCPPLSPQPSPLALRQAVPKSREEQLAGTAEVLDLENSCAGERLLEPPKPKPCTPPGPLRAPLHWPDRRYCRFLFFSFFPPSDFVRNRFCSC